MKRTPKGSVTDSDLMIIIESRTEGIKFECHKEESLISSQFLKNQEKKQNLTFFLFLFNHSSITMSAYYLYDMTENRKI